MSSHLINPYFSDLSVVLPTFVGVETAPAFWSDSSVAKSFSLNNSNRYGVSGYAQICPVATTSGISVFEDASTDNNLGATLPLSYRSNVSIPSDLLVFGKEGKYVNFSGYPPFKDPNNSQFVRNGGISVNVNNGLFDSPSGTSSAHYGVAVDLIFNGGGLWRVGIAVDTVATGQYAPDYVAAFAYPTNTVFSTQLARQGSPKLVLFNFNATPGGYANISMWQLNGTQSVSAFSLITFDRIS